MEAAAWQELVERTLAGEPRALAQLLTRVENRIPGWRKAMRALYPHTGKARVVGVTGAPGAGKSSLTNRLAAGLVERGHRVGIIAVDPSSPFSGGALLGDRLRMKDVSTAESVFIRSMATRGSPGGLCQGARDVGRVLDAAGYDPILIETVGVGQDEIDVFRAAHVVMMICVPGQGDGIQAIKAGVMEIADLFVVNKADRDGADQVEADIRGMLALAGQAPGDLETVFRTDSLSGEGVDVLLDALLARTAELPGDPERGARRAREEVLDLVEHEIAQRVRARIEADARLAPAVERICARESDPYSVAESLLADFAGLEADPHE